MVGLAKGRVEAIEEQLHSARIDFEATQHAAAKAAASAAQARMLNFFIELLFLIPFCFKKNMF